MLVIFGTDPIHYMLPCNHVEYYAIAILTPMDPELWPHTKLYNI